jgi:hypothetical protein
MGSALYSANAALSASWTNTVELDTKPSRNSNLCHVIHRSSSIAGSIRRSKRHVYFSVVRSLALFCRPLRGYMSSTWPAVAHRAHAICSHDSSGLLRLRLHVSRWRPWRARACLPPPLSILDLLAVDSTVVVASSLDTGGGGLIEVTVVDWWVWSDSDPHQSSSLVNSYSPGHDRSSCSADPLRCRKPETQQLQEGGAKCCMFAQAQLCLF